MTEAARLAPTLTGPEWVLALHQTAARGRRGRPWAMPAGNFAATLALPVTGGPAQAALRSFVAALSLRDALAALGAEVLTLKWPNDVLLNGGKVAGILLESLPGGWLSVGFGVNLAAAPSAAEVEPGSVKPLSLLGETGIAIAPEPFLDRLAPAFAGWEARFRADGFAPIRAAWLAQAARLGQPITARSGSETHAGIFETLDADGRLVLATAQGRRAIAAADVFFQEG